MESEASNNSGGGEFGLSTCPVRGKIGSILCPKGGREVEMVTGKGELHENRCVN